jgi:hypothetical protein
VACVVEKCKDFPVYLKWLTGSKVPFAIAVRIGRSAVVVEKSVLV